MADVLRLSDIDQIWAKRYAQKLHIKKDELNLIRKAYVGDIQKGEESERSIVARVSTKDKDRDGEVIEPSGIELSDYLKNACLMWAHRYTDPPIGRAMWCKIDDSGLICKFQFAQTQFADEIYQLYRDGYLRGFSIGFIPLDFDGETKTHKKISLLEVSAVPIPANQNALVMEAYAKGIIHSGKLIEDLEIKIEDFQIDEPVAMDQGAYDLAQMADEIERKAETVTKPETTDNYHRIPVSSGHDEHKIRTMTIKEGIKALYCVDCKKIITYLFDVDKYSMEEARAWVSEHKDDKIADETEEKIFDFAGNPSAWDIYSAINMALNPQPEQGVQTIAEYKSVTDFFPVNYPDGHVIYGDMVDGKPINYLQKYSYSEGTVTLKGEPQEVVVAYKKKAVFDNQRIDELMENQEIIMAILAGLHPVAQPEPEKPAEIVLDASPDIEIEDSKPGPVIEPTKEKIDEAVLDYLKSDKFKAQLSESMRVALAKLRGKVE